MHTSGLSSFNISIQIISNNNEALTKQCQWNSYFESNYAASSAYIQLHHNICKCKSQIKLILSFHSFFCSLRLRNQYYRIRMDIADNCTTFEQNCIRHQSLVISCFSEETKTTTQPVVRILNSLPQYWCLMLITKQAYANLLTKLMQVHNLTSCKGI